ncbi:cytochrome c family protein [Sphingomonas spermidinifaciens]|uniref:Cytochrome c family protein n=1 Tax=Sphingomonas spermidinifaciens TaxID=1141889 RepID=A0A2A4B6S1_9SPHN|nr:cytochrome c family protein [Sphingomonas spermidinifaciens]PCD04161.1 cytochrome c family protein [Sphingomonas spermidinifaciens]
MDNRTNTIAGWVLAGCAAALGLTIASGMVFHGERPEKMGYPIEGVVEEGAGGGEAEVPIATLLASADAAAGAEVFKKCASCHTINSGGAAGIGPNLYGVLGKPHGHQAGFAYSDALKGIAGNWDFESMNKWLTSPRKYAPGTKMSFAGLSNPQERANVIAYLNQQGSNLPLPAAPAADAAPAEAAAEGAAAANVTEGTPTADMEDRAVPASGAPSVDPEAAEEAAELKK